MLECLLLQVRLRFTFLRTSSFVSILSTPIPSLDLIFVFDFIFFIHLFMLLVSILQFFSFSFLSFYVCFNIKEILDIEKGHRPREFVVAGDEGIFGGCFFGGVCGYVFRFLE